MCGDATKWDEEAYRDSILKERGLRTLTVFRTAWPPSLNPTPQSILLASSHGTLASYATSSCISNLVLTSHRPEWHYSFANTMCSSPPSAFSVSLHPSGLTAIGGYGGLVDIISQFGSHYCTFQCGYT